MSSIRTAVMYRIQHGHPTPAASMDLMDSASAIQGDIYWVSPTQLDDDQDSSRSPSTTSHKRRIVEAPTYAEPEELDFSFPRRKRYQCQSCKNRVNGFSTLNDLHRHEKSVHGRLKSGDRYWVCQVPGCPISEKLWPRFDNFRSHVSRMHGESRVDEIEKMRRTYQSLDTEPIEMSSGGPTSPTQPSTRSGNTYSQVKITGNARAMAPNTVPHSQPQPHDYALHNMDEGARALMDLRHHRSRPSTPLAPARADTSDAQKLQNAAMLKRLTRTDQDQHESDDDESMNEESTTKSSLGTSGQERFWACPFLYANPHNSLTDQAQHDQTSNCSYYKLKSISALKQHLRRQHRKPDFYCAFCYQTHPTSEARDRHMRERRCIIRDQNPFDNNSRLMTDEVWARVNQKKGRSQNDYEEWYRIFETVWPHAPRPRSPYVASEASAWHDVMLEIFRLSGPSARSLHEQLLKSCDAPPPMPASTRAVIQNAFELHEERSGMSTKVSYDVRPPLEKSYHLESISAVPTPIEDNTATEPRDSPLLHTSTSPAASDCQAHSAEQPANRALPSLSWELLPSKYLSKEKQYGSTKLSGSPGLIFSDIKNYYMECEYLGLVPRSNSFAAKKPTAMLGENNKTEHSQDESSDTRSSEKGSTIIRRAESDQQITSSKEDEVFFHW